MAWPQPVLGALIDSSLHPCAFPTAATAGCYTYILLVCFPVWFLSLAPGPEAMVGRTGLVAAVHCMLYRIPDKAALPTPHKRMEDRLWDGQLSPDLQLKSHV